MCLSLIKEVSVSIFICCRFEVARIAPIIPQMTRRFLFMISISANPKSKKFLTIIWNIDSTSIRKRLMAAIHLSIFMRDFFRDCINCFDAYLFVEILVLLVSARHVRERTIHRVCNWSPQGKWRPCREYLLIQQVRSRLVAKKIAYHYL